MKHTTEQLEAIAAKLREMPPVEKKKQEHSKQNAVRILSKEIALLQKRGYTLDQISETLRGEGLSIATPTLKSYLQRAKPAKKAPVQAPGDTPLPLPLPAVKKPADTSKTTFTPKPDSDDI
ncbi:protein mobC (plasmid) [Pseudomonas aeruginosa]|uniref:protein mobC n=1 Tax=Gammaproteobacteria TaxID=1236 RepID=UPI00227B1BEC|nr:MULTISPECIES: protein mobC [Gammaproteobacteria]MBX6889955.1 protein mobC [Pseudomonas aeruginosa]WHV35235.1 protein mobC [Pseudomonas aeruginosa]